MVLTGLLEEAEWQRVEKNSFAVSDSEVLGIDHLGSCIGVGIYDPQDSRTALLHAGTRENTEIEEILDAFLEEIDFEWPYEALAGGTISSDYDPLIEDDVYEQARETVGEALEESGFRYQTAWNDRPVYNRMAVSPEHGILYDETR
ncbi:MAG: hypothetical protein ABEJ75_03900 [Candidatus Nanohaloarchaea archaeon]